MTFTPYFTQTNVFNNAILRLPAAGTIAQIDIPMHLTQLDAMTTNATLVETSYGPVIDQPTNTASGGTTYMLGAGQVPKLVIAGWIDTPSTVQTIGGQPYDYPNVVVDGNKVTYAEIIAMYFEGRVQSYTDNSSIAPGVYWQRVQPLFFRDTMGRVYNTPKIYAYTATRVEQQPYRNNFNMTLQLVGT